MRNENFWIVIFLVFGLMLLANLYVSFNTRHDLNKHIEDTVVQKAGPREIEIVVKYENIQDTVKQSKNNKNK